MTKIQKITSALVAIIVIGGIFIMIKKNQSTSDLTSNTNKVVSTSTAGTIISTSNGGTYTIEQVPVDEGRGAPQPIPDLNRSSNGYGSKIVTPEAIAQALPHIAELQTMLKKNPAYFDAWIDLGIYQKMAGDYQGSVISWQYASKLAPGDYISLGNIANLYGYFLNNSGLAFEYYKAAISKGPTQQYLYIQLAEYYMDMGDSQNALKIVNQGLSKVPNDLRLNQLKSALTSS